MSNRNWELFEKLVEEIGAEQLAEDICRYVSSDSMNEILEDLAREWEVIEDDE